MNSEIDIVLLMKIYVRSTVAIYLMTVYSISILETFPDLHYIFGPEDSAQVGFEYTYRHLCGCVCTCARVFVYTYVSMNICVYVYMYVCMYLNMYIQGSSVEMRTLTERNLIGGCMIALPPNSNFPPASGHCPLFPAKENLVHVYKMSLFHVIYIFKLIKSEIL